MLTLLFTLLLSSRNSGCSRYPQSVCSTLLKLSKRWMAVSEPKLLLTAFSPLPERVAEDELHPLTAKLNFPCLFPSLHTEPFLLKAITTVRFRWRTRRPARHLFTFCFLQRHPESSLFIGLVCRSTIDNF
ncbi:hypothetical protein RvY_05942 [Ramazzottius varieornatus]|uniref:Secreted protein n=1 Tax=Ramazzottius varieornatus TaxID=947166 RepID=A0A1D1V5Q3_RAMVA|nr:hypothetical protein RvY_05942 [Ramazzottius varieornatus]